MHCALDEFFATRHLSPFCSNFNRHAGVFDRVDLVNFPMQCAAADPEFFRGSRHVTVGGCQGLQDQFPLGFVQIERARLLTENALSGEMPRGSGVPAPSRMAIGKSRNVIFTSSHDNAMLNRRPQFAHVTRPVVNQQRVHGLGGKIDDLFIIFFAEVPNKNCARETGCRLSDRAVWRHRGFGPHLA